ncbi:MAG: DPP IV N-terminal domain-containing protein, partial [Bacteroidia bacterium]|nr:DPP IV N-terminal domain-containing protein [Bacteroidia bacterium]
MKFKMSHLLIVFLLIGVHLITAQEASDSSLLSIDRIFSGEFDQDSQRTIQWIENGNAYVTIEKSATKSNSDELVRYISATQERMLFAPAEALNSLAIESFTLSPDGSKVLIFTNSSRVWRSNTKGDYWVYDLTTKTLKRLGDNLGVSSLMFAKFSTDNRFVYYVHKFNIYKEDFQSGNITQLTYDGTGDIINGTFDWAYEEEFGKRDGFTISPNDEYIAFWQLDASEIDTFYM